MKYHNILYQSHTSPLGVIIGWGQRTYEHILTYVGSLEPMDLF
jgi:hypothetical protein